jgi:hypothetical protein
MDGVIDYLSGVFTNRFKDSSAKKNGEIADRSE